ncbi:hypothetical protein HMPREF1502_4941 [Klebsiella sp. AS10]|nr:hypothetical protein HMPREF1502_4941 [Klebsiella sp. AS10]
MPCPLSKAHSLLLAQAGQNFSAADGRPAVEKSWPGRKMSV